MKIKAIIWDFWGVLGNAKGGSIVTHWAQLLNVPIEKVIDIFTGSELLQLQADEMSNDDFYEFALTKMGLPLKKKTDLWNQSEDDFEYDNELMEYIKRLKAEDYILALLTNIDRHFFEASQKAWPEFFEQFDHIIASCEVKMIKPDPRIYQITLEKIGCEGQEAVFIDDTEDFIQAAEKFGIRGIVFKNSKQAINELENII